MRRVCAVLLGLGLSGCFDYEAYQRSAAKETCEWADRCGFMMEETVSGCVVEATEDIAANATCKNYNPDAARSCLEEISEIDCFDLGDFLDLDVCAGVCSN